MTETLDGLLIALVGDTSDVTEKDGEYARDGVVFAARTGPNAVQLRLGPDLAEAARRTRDTGPSRRGDEWVQFAPSAWDDHARDRLEAWFRVAWRMAGDTR